MNQYQGAVFFVDMLGVGALTQNQVTLSEGDFNAWGMKPSLSSSANLFCGQLLTTFRSCLAAIGRSHKQVKIAQLSDCAYIWSENVFAVLDAARAFMWDSVNAGLLSRGGISYGEIVEPDKINRAIGHFILGGSVTRAVGLEKAGKGCRIFVDDLIHRQLQKSDATRFQNGAFSLLKNPLDGTVVREFCWYATGGSEVDWSRQPHVAATKLITVLTKLQFAPRFNWNQANQHGRIQLACSIDSISAATPTFIGNGNYMLKGEDYALQLEVSHDRFASDCQQVLRARLADIERFFVDGMQKDPMQRWLERQETDVFGGAGT
ncbi:hypothetical protein [Pseudomonas syringae]|uniref:Uncharacterized protein n=1 Tax=Pseudomonas syringae pv. syringae TaxID=321 RepID=A0AAE5S3G5_PSESY|nr:hypothetical protein [Pseudomonas syringae]PBP57529.1 hypothetical protein CCL10_05070 [Pseudomonas syringae]POQ01445.1 hypothetical protein CXB42_23065 [Pseudomonas syringae pv. syringae]UOF20141.1 hypothetical protein N023_00970 [Pseudomonas syringae CC440]UZA77686.1 hypothetical protein EZZ79_01040 [Pseudomonas syringae]